MSRQFAKKRVRDLKRTPNHLRLNLGTEAERALGESYLAHPINPIVVHLSDLLILDGNRRAAAVELVAGPDAEVPVCLTDEENITPAVLLDIQLDSDEFTKHLAPYERFFGYSEWLRLNPNKTAKDLAEKRRIDQAQVCRVLTLARCIASVQEAAKAGLVDVSAWTAISKSRPEDQPALLKLKLSGASRDELERQSRKRRNPGADEKVDSVRIAMPGGVTLLVKGKELTLSSLADILLKCHREATGALKDGLTAKTFQSTMRDRSKKKPEPQNGETNKPHGVTGN